MTPQSLMPLVSSSFLPLMLSEFVEERESHNKLEQVWRRKVAEKILEHV